MTQDRIEFQEFEERNSLPARTTKESLLSLGARHFQGEGYRENGTTNIVQQMQYQRGSELYMWKRIGPVGNIDEKMFEIHLEINPNGYHYFPTKSSK